MKVLFLKIGAACIALAYLFGLLPVGPLELAELIAQPVFGHWMQPIEDVRGMALVLKRVIGAFLWFGFLMLLVVRPIASRQSGC